MTDLWPDIGSFYTFPPRRTNCRHHIHNLHIRILNVNKLALLWGEAQKKIAYSYLKVT